MVTLNRGEMYARQAIARGDDMCYIVVIPSIRLYRFEVANILGEVQDTLMIRHICPPFRSDNGTSGWKSCESRIQSS